ncbi:hypothetical protein [Kitasatospora sp. NPDC094016]|uniref:hypothetical protein n=1 Tax=Kitasatospora sp. NPDC094016 TaxID=3154986 RepID=UPI00331FCFF0
MHDRATRRAAAAANALHPAEPLSEAAYLRGLDAMFAAVDESFEPPASVDSEARATPLPAEEMAVQPAEVGTVSVDGMRVVAARSVEAISDKDLPEIAAQVAQFMAERHDLAAHDR